MLTFGVTVLPDPPHGRFVELFQLAEQHGFDWGWTYDSHILWQESTPLLALVAANTERIHLGHCVTNPASREPTVLASAYATLQDISNGRMFMGIGRGDSARRVIGLEPVRMAEFERSLVMIKDLMNGRRVEWNGKELELTWAQGRPEIPMYVAGYGPKALGVAGRVGDGVVIQLADPDIVEWIMGIARRSAEEAGRDPSLLKPIVCAPAFISDDMARAREQVRWFPAMVSNHVMDLLKRYPGVGAPRAALRVRQAARVLRLQGSQPRRGEARRVRRRRHVRPLLHPRNARGSRREASATRGDRRRPLEHLPDDRGAGADPRDLRD